LLIGPNTAGVVLAWGVVAVLVLAGAIELGKWLISAAGG
jgi:hypothetical protein